MKLLYIIFLFSLFSFNSPAKVYWHPYYKGPKNISKYQIWLTSNIKARQKQKQPTADLVKALNSLKGTANTEAGTCRNCNHNQGLQKIPLNRIGGRQHMPCGHLFYNTKFQRKNLGTHLVRELNGRGRSTKGRRSLFFPQNEKINGPAYANGMKALCPSFFRMNDRQKEFFWTWAFASIAKVESECGTNQINKKDPNGWSIGLLQMPEIEKPSGKWLSASWRGPGCRNHYGKAFIGKTLYRQGNKLNAISCGVEVLGNSLCGAHSKGGKGKGCNGWPPRARTPYGKHIFWKQLKKFNGKITRRIKSFPGCNRG